MNVHLNDLDFGDDLALLGCRWDSVEQGGGDLSAGHYFFKRDVNGVRTHKLHVCLDGHGQIERMLRFRDHLRKDAVDRSRYQELKLTLERENTSGIQQYLIAKDPLIQDVLANLD